jgi:hypothetical protein
MHDSSRWWYLPQHNVLTAHERGKLIKGSIEAVNSGHGWRRVSHVRITSFQTGRCMLAEEMVHGNIIKDPRGDRRDESGASKPYQTLPQDYFPSSTIIYHRPPRATVHHVRQSLGRQHTTAADSNTADTTSTDYGSERTSNLTFHAGTKPSGEWSAGSTLDVTYKDVQGFGIKCAICLLAIAFGQGVCGMGDAPSWWCASCAAVDASKELAKQRSSR